MKAIQTILIGVILIGMAATQYFQGKTIASMQQTMNAMAKTDTAQSDALQETAKAIKTIGECLRVQNNSIRKLAEIR